MTQNHAKRHFWREFRRKILHSYLCIENWHRLHQKMTLLLPEMFYRIGSRGGQPFWRAGQIHDIKSSEGQELVLRGIGGPSF